MKLTNALVCLLIGILVTSCIKSEAPNAEADIITCTVPGDILLRSPRIGNYQITLIPKENADVTNIKMEFTLTAGATIDPPSGTARDFTEPQTYTVTSEDGKWKKEYTVAFNDYNIQTKYDFECSEVYDNKYCIFYEVLNGKRQDFWASGNSTSTIVFGNEGPDAFPMSSSPNGKSGNCLKLETKSTGNLGAMAGRPIAAGTLFIGEFMSLIAVEKPLEAPRYGVPFFRIPVSLTGYYKYKAGDMYTDGNGKVVTGKKDDFNIYGILYEVDEEVGYLDGSNSLTSPNLIAIARFNQADKKEVSEWTAFNLPFVMQSGKAIDPDKLAAGNYNISIVFSSSIDGATFNAAVGSLLMVDEVEIHCQE